MIYQVLAKMFLICSKTKKACHAVLFVGREQFPEERAMALQDIIRRAIELGRPTGCITFDELSEQCPTEVESEDIEAVMGALSDAGDRYR
jgi:sigma-70-like protein